MKQGHTRLKQRLEQKKNVKRDKVKNQEEESDQPGENRTAERIRDSNHRHGRALPKADNIDEFWENLRDGVECISAFRDEELLAAGVEAEAIATRITSKQAR